MLSFDWVEGAERLGIQYLEDRLDETDMATRILENIEEGIKNNNVLINHIDYCKRHNIKEILPFALHEIANVDRDNEVRRVALEVTCQISKTLSDLEQILPDIKDDFKWNVVEQLVKSNSKRCHAFLVKVLRGGNERDQFKAAEYLVELKDLEGLKYYVAWMKRHKRFPERLLNKPAFLSLRSLKSVPFLIELLQISYQKNFIQDDFDGLHQVVLDTLTAIALQSDQHYAKINKTVEQFINKYSTVIENVNFLYVFVEKLEQKYYVIKDEKLDINDVTEKLEKIWPHYE